MHVFKQWELYGSVWINLLLLISHPNEYSQELDYYPFVVKLDRHIGSCDTLNDLWKRLYLGSLYI